MKATQLLHNLGQSLWLDNITRDLLNSGTLKRYIDELSVTGLTSNPTIFDHAIKNSTAYDAAIRKKLDEGKSGEELFFELALEDLTRAAELVPAHPRTDQRRRRVGIVGGVAPARLRHRQHSRRGQGLCTTGRGVRTCSSRFPARRKVCRRSKRRFSPVCRSTSRCCFPASSTSPRPRRFCAGSSGASMPDSGPMSVPWLRCSSAVGMPRSRARCRPR